MKKLLWIVWLWVLVLPAFAQPDTLQKPVNRKVHWLVGGDGFSALNGVSIIGGIEKNRIRYSMSLSHFWRSSRLGVYYDYNIIKKFRVWMGVGLHSSFKFDEFDKSRHDYVAMLDAEHIRITSPEFAFLPNYGEVRNLYFISLSLSKEFKINKDLFINAKVEGVSCYNPFYKEIGFSPLYGLQMYYKW